jgi:hypothetical protein
MPRAPRLFASAELTEPILDLQGNSATYLKDLFAVRATILAEKVSRLYDGAQEACSKSSHAFGTPIGDSGWRKVHGGDREEALKLWRPPERK